MRAYETLNRHNAKWQVMNDENGKRYFKYSTDQYRFGLDYSQGYDNSLIHHTRMTNVYEYKQISLLRMLLVAGVFFLTGCGPICEQEPFLHSLIQDMIQLTSINPQNVCSAGFAELPSNNYGLASTIPLYRCDIYIRPNLPPLSLRATVYHEVAHCVGLNHTSDGLMRSHAYEEVDYKQNWKGFEREFVDLVKKNK